MRAEPRMMAVCLAFLCAAAGALLQAPVRALAQAAPPTVSASVSEGATHAINIPPHENHQYYERTGVLDTGKIRYAVKYCSCWDPSHGEQASPLEGYIGMPEPNACNWYHSGFMRVVINGQDIGSTKLSDMYAGESGERGAVTMLWKAPIATVRVRFVALPDDDRLFCEIGLDPTAPVTALQIALNCYPSFFTAAYHRDGWRRVTTATRSVEQGAKLEAKPADEWWLAYTDDVFDPPKDDAAAGGCGLLFDPQQVQAATAVLGSYNVATDLALDPAVRAIRLVFWDLNKRPNAEAIKSVSATADATLKQLREMDFAPLAVSSFDLAARSAAVASELKKVTQPGDFPARFEVLHRQLGPLLVQARQAKAEGRAIPVEVEKALAEQMKAYDALQWELRFYVLLND